MKDRNIKEKSRYEKKQRKKLWLKRKHWWKNEKRNSMFGDLEEEVGGITFLFKLLSDSIKVRIAGLVFSPLTERFCW